MSNTILRNSFFDADTNGHGGNRRTAQLNELVVSAGYEVSDISRYVIKDPVGNLLSGIGLVINKHNFPVYTPQELVASGWAYRLYKKAFTEHSDVKVLL